MAVNGNGALLDAGVPGRAGERKEGTVASWDHASPVQPGQSFALEARKQAGTRAAGDWSLGSDSIPSAVEVGLAGDTVGPG